MSEEGEITVLIVDDNERNMRLARDVLRFAGLSTLEAETGETALEVAARELPDVILMDIRLPDMDGSEAMRRLRRDPATAGLTIVALTSLAMKGDREWLLAEGFDGYLEKPIDVRAFPGQVRAFAARTA